MISITEKVVGNGRFGWRLPPNVISTLRIGGSVIITLVSLMALTFFIGRMLPIDPVLAILGDDAGQEAYDRVYKDLGLDKPIPVQFASFVKAMVTLDFGRSITTGNLVASDLARVFPATVELATFAMAFGLFLGVPLGVAAAVYRGRFIDHLFRIFALIGFSTPIFWLGLMGLLLFYAKLDWLAGPGRIDIAYMWEIKKQTGMLLLDSALAGQWEIFGNLFSHILMPGFFLGYGATAYISRMTRSFMLDQLNQEYIVTARVKGLSQFRIIWRHAFRNILVQLITVIALSYAFLLEGAVLTESVFAWPGFGRYLTTGLLRGDMSVVVPCTLIVGIIFVALNLFTDLLYRFMDPRSR